MLADDVITINRRMAADARVKLAICHAIAQVRVRVRRRRDAGGWIG